MGVNNNNWRTVAAIVGLAFAVAGSTFGVVGIFARQEMEALGARIDRMETRFNGRLERLESLQRIERKIDLLREEYRGAVQ